MEKKKKTKQQNRLMITVGNPAYMGILSKTDFP